MTTSNICQRCGKQYAPVLNNGTGVKAFEYCTCHQQWTADAEPMPLYDWRDAELARLRAELAQARAEIAKQDAELDAAAKDTLDAAHRLQERGQE